MSKDMAAELVNEDGRVTFFWTGFVLTERTQQLMGTGE
jgi:hypothetical protein